MPSPPNELTGPRLYVAVDNKKSAPMHLTGGYRRPHRKSALCGTQIGGKTLVDARDIAPHTEYKDSSLWCKRCFAMLDFEGLDQKVLFAAIEFNGVSYSDYVLIGHLRRSKKAPKRPFILTNAPKREDWRIVE